MAKETLASVASPQLRLAGKVAIITGGASGLGASTVKLFHENGGKVVIADIKDDEGRGLAEKLGDDNVCYVHCDVRNEDEIIELIDSAIARYGKLDILYNNAGIKITQNFGSILDATKSDLESLISVNLAGAFLAAKHAARVMIPQRKGCILFTSVNNIESPPAAAAARYGILGLTKNLAAEIGQYGIRVNCVSPSGLVKNMFDYEKPDFGDNDRKVQIVRAEDVAKAVLFLASDEANYVSGLNLVIDGDKDNPAMIRALDPMQ